MQKRTTECSIAQFDLTSVFLNIIVDKLITVPTCLRMVLLELKSCSTSGLFYAFHSHFAHIRYVHRFEAFCCVGSSFCVCTAS